MADMIYTLVIELVDMLVDQRVENMFALLTCGDDAQGAQEAKMMRHRRLAHAQHQAEIAHEEFGVRQ